ncbi:GNAT family N-acetyltransferase [Clostridium massiliamazoniense]|uniref:GNAT family N-acetyltransferase n=1 Tax=Clostridium massiliamazoniense TaxID=1347366 RepID=UPI0006D770DE|nr:N-acetyltransferase [Clostridium massiliamazoniense]
MIRVELEKDYEKVEVIVKKAFEEAEFSDKTEHILVNKLRGSESFIKELSIVAELEGEIVGHCLFTEGKIKNEDKEFRTLVLAPLSVLPEYQRKGIGSELVNEGIKKAKNLGYESIVVLGHHHYYPKFGFERSSKYGVKAPFEVPEEALMVLQLKENSLDEVSGIIIYAKEFFE